MIDEQAATHPKHDCYAWNVQCYRMQGDASMSLCMICERITSFRWKSPWRHIMEGSKKWWQSKSVITSIVTAVIGVYLTLQPQFGWPAIPEWVFAILGSIGVYTRITATKAIG